MSQREANTRSWVNAFHEGNNSPLGARVLIGEPEQHWHDEVIKQLNLLVKLNHGWDGYEATSVSFENASFSLRMLESICRNSAVTPQIIPGISGDLQIEWHTFQGDIELHVKAPNDVHFWYSFLGSDAEEGELDLTIDFTEVAKWVLKITEPPIALRAASA